MIHGGRYNSESVLFGIIDAVWVQPPAFQLVMNIKIDVNSPTQGGLPRWNRWQQNSYDRA